MARIDGIDVPSLTFPEAAAPGTPAAGKVIIYAKSDGLFYSKDDAGTETVVTGSGAGSTLVGPTPRAFPISHDPSSAYSTAVAVAANGGSLAIAMVVPGPMNFDSVRVRNTDTGTARTWGWDLYKQNGATNVLDRVAASNGDESFTPGAASVRTLAAASAPVVLDPGVYWLVIQSTHATSSFGVGSTAPAALASAAAQTKTTTNPNGATLDFTAATWTKVIASYAVVMDGRVFNEATPF